MRTEFKRPRDEHNDWHVCVYDIETIVSPDDEMPDGSFPPWPRHKPIAASFLLASTTDDGGTGFAFETVVLEDDDEVTFLLACARLLAPGVTVSYNGRGFDANVVRIRLMAHGIFSAMGIAQHAHAPRFGDAHCDLADQFSGYGATRKVSLAELCAPLSIPCKTSVHGSDVGALWRAGQTDTIRAYVEEDVAATYLLWLHWNAFRQCREDKFALPLSAFAQWIEASDRDHLLPFATCPPALRARQSAPGYRLARAVASAQRLVDHERNEAAFGGPIDFTT